MVNFIKDIYLTVLGYLRADWLILLFGIVLAVVINVYIDSKKMERFLSKNSKLSITGSIAFGAFTPLCACGTMAVLLSMFITSMPWGPVMAFLVSSPLTSPSEFMFESAFLGTGFAVAVLAASLVLGLLAGYLAHILAAKTSFFKDQFRFLKTNTKSCCSTEAVCCDVKAYDCDEAAVSNTCCNPTKSSYKISSIIKKYKLDAALTQFYSLGIRKVLLYFIIFIAVGRVFEIIIPREWILSLFSSTNSYSIPLGATIGLPLYVSGSAALPIMKSFMNSGAGEGVLLAFLITGKATGIPVIAGMSTILKKKALLFYVGFVYIGGIAAGYVYQLIINLVH